MIRASGIIQLLGIPAAVYFFLKYGGAAMHGADHGLSLFVWTPVALIAGIMQTSAPRERWSRVLGYIACGIQAAAILGFRDWPIAWLLIPTVLSVLLLATARTSGAKN